MGRAKHKPQRICIACRKSYDKRALIRIVRTPAGLVEVDRTGKANGRGAYLCQEEVCWEKALQKRILASTLKVVLSNDDINRLQANLQN